VVNLATVDFPRGKILVEALEPMTGKLAEGEARSEGDRFEVDCELAARLRQTGHVKIIGIPDSLRHHPVIRQHFINELLESKT